MFCGFDNGWCMFCVTIMVYMLVYVLSFVICCLWLVFYLCGLGYSCVALVWLVVSTGVMAVGYCG